MAKNKEIKYICSHCKYWLTPTEVTFKKCPSCYKLNNPVKDGFYTVEY